MKNTAHNQGRGRADFEDNTVEILEDAVCLSPALSFVDDKVFIGRNILQKREMAGDQVGQSISYDVEVPVLICSDRSVIEIPKPKTKDAAELIPLGKNYVKGRISSMPKRWSIESINEFLNETDAGPPDIRIVYANIVKAFKEWCYLAEEYNYDVLSLHVLGSYFYPLWNSYPYVNLNGPKGSGKTTVGSVAEQIAFNGLQLVDPSPASLFRQIESLMPYLVIDEAENVKSGRDAELNHSLMSVLKAGYQKGPQIPRQNQRSIGVTELFNVFSPKLICNVHGNEEILQDRSFSVITTIAPKGSVSRVRPTGQNPMFKTLRDSLYLSLMYHHKTVSNIVRRSINNDQDNRLGELSQPLLDLAYWVDGCRKNGKVAENVRKAIKYQYNVRLFANEHTTVGALVRTSWAILEGKEECDVTPKDFIKVLQKQEPDTKSISPTMLGKLLSTNRIIDPRLTTRRGKNKEITYKLSKRILEKLVQSKDV